MFIIDLQFRHIYKDLQTKTACKVGWDEWRQIFMLMWNQNRVQMLMCEHWMLIPSENPFTWNYWKGDEFESSNPLAKISRKGDTWYHQISCSHTCNITPVFSLFVFLLHTNKFLFMNVISGSFRLNSGKSGKLTTRSLSSAVQARWHWFTEFQLNTVMVLHIYGLLYIHVYMYTMRLSVKLFFFQDSRRSLGGIPVDKV